MIITLYILMINEFALMIPKWGIIHIVRCLQFIGIQGHFWHRYIGIKLRLKPSTICVFT